MTAVILAFWLRVHIEVYVGEVKRQLFMPRLWTETYFTVTTLVPSRTEA